MLRLCLATVLIFASPVQTSADGLPKRADQLLAELAPANSPGATALIARNGQILWIGASGKSDLEAGTPLRADDVFRYGSIAKQFTAALILKLVADKSIRLEDTLGELLPTRTPTSWHGVTVRQLLNHTSGIPSNTDQPSLRNPANLSRRWSTQELIDLTRDVSLNFVPGTDYRYNNTGYTLLAAIIEEKTGNSWHEALRDRITGPLGLSSIRCGCEPGGVTVKSYSGGGRPSIAFDMSIPSAAGALVGNVRDLARWAEALHSGKVLPPALYKEMITPSRLADGRTVPYGLGLMLGDLSGEPWIGHGGSIPGFLTDSAYLPKRRLFAAMLTNSDTNKPAAEPGTRRFLALAAGLPLRKFTKGTYMAGLASAHLGDYRNVRGRLRLEEREGNLHLRFLPGSFSRQAFATDQPNTFFFGPDSLDWFRLTRDGNGKPLIELFVNGAETPLNTTWAGSQENGVPSR